MRGWIFLWISMQRAPRDGGFGRFFHNSYVRYLSGHDLLRVLAQKFPEGLGVGRGFMPRLTDRDLFLWLGGVQPSDGNVPFSAAPSPAFLHWWVRRLSRNSVGD